MAVLETERKKGIGKALLLKSLESMRELGYTYAIIGWPARSAIDFYKKCEGAATIEEKSSGVYKRMIEIDSKFQFIGHSPLAKDQPLGKCRKRDPEIRVPVLWSGE